MFDIKRARQDLHDLKASGRLITDLCRKEERIMSAEEQKACDDILGKVKDQEKEIAKIEKQMDTERLLAPLDIAPGSERDRANNGKEDPRRSGGFADCAEFAKAVHAACSPSGSVIDPRLTAMRQAAIMAAPSNQHTEGGSGGEGYMVPPDQRDAIWDIAFEESLLSIFSPEPTNSNSVQINKDESTPWGSTGVQANWRAEGTQMTGSRLATNQIDVKLNELYAFVLANEELLQDAPRLNNRLTMGAGRAIGWKSTEAIFRGNGVGQPLGFLNSGALISVAKETSQTADTVVAANVIKQFSRLLTGNPSRSVWFANSDVLPSLMVTTVGDQPVWLAPSGLQASPGGTLMGSRVVLTEHADTVGDVGDLTLVDPAGYYATQRTGTQFATSIHLFFDYAVQAFRWMFRFGGQPFMTGAITPPNSALTKSHFVAIAARA